VNIAVTAQVRFLGKWHSGAVQWGMFLPYDPGSAAVFLSVLWPTITLRPDRIERWGPTL
jgi:hypothetical protein